MSGTNGLMDYFARIGVDASECLGGIQAAQGSFLSFYRDVTVSLNMTMQIFREFERIGVEAFNETAGSALHMTQFDLNMDAWGGVKKHG